MNSENLKRTLQILEFGMEAIKRGKFDGLDIGYLADLLSWLLSVQQNLAKQLVEQESNKSSSEVK